MAKVKSKIESPLVNMPSDAYIPERDLDKLPVLEARHLGIDFGGLTAVDDFNLTIGRTEIAGLIGPNGAGKTTVFNLLTKVYQPTRGTIMVDGKRHRRDEHRAGEQARRGAHLPEHHASSPTSRSRTTSSSACTTR